MTAHRHTSSRRLIRRYRRSVTRIFRLVSHPYVSFSDELADEKENAQALREELRRRSIPVP